MTFKNDIALFFNVIKTSKENKVLFPYKIKLVKFKKILSILSRYGLIWRYGLIENRLFLHRNPFTLLDISRHNRDKFFSAYKLKSLSTKFRHNIYIISTPVGIFESRDALKYNLGGYLLFVIKPKNSM